MHQFKILKMNEINKEKTCLKKHINMLFKYFIEIVTQKLQYSI